MANPHFLRGKTLFVEAAKRLSFSQATRAIDMPISLPSRRITLIEEAERSFDERIIRAERPSGPPRIAAPPDERALSHLSTLSMEFLRRQEHVRLHIDLRGAPFDIAGNKDGLAITIDEPMESSLIVQTVAQVENGLFATLSYRGARERPEMPCDLEDHQLILPKQGLDGERRMTRG